MMENKKKVEVEIELETEVLKKSEILAKGMGLSTEEYISFVLENKFKTKE